MTFKALWQQVNNKERRLIALVSLVAIIISTAPVVYGWLATPAGKVFTGMHFVSADDWFVYYSYIGQAQQGRILFADLFAPLAHLPMLQPLWLVVGWLGWPLHLPAWATLNLGRVILIPLFFVMAYLFIAYLFKSEKVKQVALWLLAFSSGCGWLMIYRLVQNPLNASQGQFQWPMDLWVPDINTYYTLHTSPHFIAATILLLIIFLATLLFTDRPRYYLAVIAGLAALSLFSFHPFQVIKVYVILALFFIVWWFKLRQIVWSQVFFGLVVFILSLPVSLYYLWLFRVDWLTTQRTLQNFNPTTPIYLTIISFGWLLVFALIGVYFLLKRWKKITADELFLIVWLIVQLLLLYLPVSYQRRLGLGVHFPLVMLAVIAGVNFYQCYIVWFKKHLVSIITISFLLFLPSTFFVIAADLMVFSQQRELSYLTKDAYQTFIWLKQNTPATSIIFSDVKTGNVLPAYALRTSYVGHPVESPFYNQRKLEPAWFFSQNRLAEEEINFLQQRRINYLFYGPREQLLGDYRPATKNYLRNVYQNQSVVIYQVL